MHTACVDGQRLIVAIEYAKLSAGEREELRGRLSCPDHACAAPVHFRSRSVDGRPPLFYSNEHAPFCTEKSPETKQAVLEGEKREDEAIWNDASELVLRLDGPKTDRASVIDGIGPTVTQRGRRHNPRRGERHTHASSIGLRPLLRRLRDDPSFRASTMPLTLSDETQSSIQEACTHVSHYVHRFGKRVVVWGPVVAAQNGWINSGYREEELPAVLVREKFIAEVLGRVYLKKFADLNPGDRGSFHFIVEGLFRMTKHDTPWVTLESPNHLALLPDPPAGG